MANAKISELPLLQKLGNTGAAPSASRNWDFAYTWSSGGTTFNGLYCNFTDIASAAASLVVNIAVGGVSQIAVSKAGVLSIGNNVFMTPIGGTFYIGSSGAATYGAWGAARLNAVAGAVIGWASSTDGGGTLDTCFGRKAAGVSEANNGTKGSYTGSAFGSGSQTVAQLPTAATAGAGARSFVTDATATTFLSTVAGGGANGVPVVSNGTNWLIG